MDAHYTGEGTGKAKSNCPLMNELNVILKQTSGQDVILIDDVRELNGGVKNFLVAGSYFEYGKSAENFDFIPSDAPLLPITTYAISKAASSVVFSGWAIMNKIKLKYLRIFQVYGEGELETRFWPSLRKAALEGKDFPMTKGEQIRDFINVSEVAKRFVIELDFSNVTQGVPFIANLGSGKPQTLREFAEYWWKEWGAKGSLIFGILPYREYEIMRIVPKI